MKANPFMKTAVVCVVISLAVMPGCKYDVTEPLWDKPYTAPPATPEITQMIPAQRATAGVNTITIQGRDLGGVPDTNGVYFGTAPAEVVQKSATAITVRRPTLVTESCTVKVVSDSALLVAKSPGTYAIDPVFAKYGAFNDNVALSALAVDNEENLYVVLTDSRNIVKVTPTGETLVLGTTTLPPTDARIGPDGRLYLMAGNRQINAVNVQSGALKLWRNCPSGKIVKFGDFDPNKYFYTGGVRTDLVIISPDSTFKYAGVYSTSEILGVRVYNGYVYVVAKNPAGQTPSTGIWRHSIAAGGSLGPKELVLDWDGAGPFASRTIRAIAFATNGIMYIATDSPNPMLIFDPATHSLDYFYKNIIPSYCKQFCWGRGNSIYLISGNTSPAQDWLVYRVDMGTTGASY